MCRTFEGSPFLSVGLALATMAVSACGDGPNGPGTGSSLTELCLEMTRDLFSVLPQDAIPALTDPTLVQADDVLADYLLPTDRVIGLDLGDDFIAVPHNILWWHEIVNLNDAGLAVTYCPFTGSSMVFHREGAGGAEFGTSGLLFKNNLVMYDRTPNSDDETLWPQMVAGARCGPAEGRELSMFPAIEIEWEDWVALHPDTRVVGRNTPDPRIYTADRYPYGDYEVEDNPRTLSPPTDEFDPRRPPKERVLGIPFEDGGAIAFPFGALRSVGDVAAVHETLGGGENVVVFWDSEAVAAMAYLPWAGQNLTFEGRDGAIVDLETGSRWSVDGEALSGPMAGQKLAKIPEAYVSFWFAFATFFPNPDLWLP